MVNMERFCCHLTSTHLFLRIQHVLLVVIIHVHWTSEINGAFVARKSFEKINILQKWEHVSYWYIHAVSECGRKIQTCLCEMFEILKVHFSWQLEPGGRLFFQDEGVTRNGCTASPLCAQLQRRVQQFQRKLRRGCLNANLLLYLRIQLGLILALSFVLLEYKIDGIIYWGTWGYKWVVAIILPVLLWRHSWPFQSCVRVELGWSDSRWQGIP